MHVDVFPIRKIRSVSTSIGIGTPANGPREQVTLQPVAPKPVFETPRIYRVFPIISGRMYNTFLSLSLPYFCRVPVILHTHTVHITFAYTPIHTRTYKLLYIILAYVSCIYAINTHTQQTRFPPPRTVQRRVGEPLV